MDELLKAVRLHEGMAMRALPRDQSHEHAEMLNLDARRTVVQTSYLSFLAATKKELGTDS